MTTLFEFKSLSIILIMIITALAGFIPFQKHSALRRGLDFPSGNAIACGVFLGAGLIHMLGDADAAFIAAGYHYPFALVIAGSCFLFLLLIEHIGNEMRHHEQANHTAITVVAVIMLSLHSFLEGAALGLSLQMATALLILFAILAHKWAESFSLSLQINKTPLLSFHRYSLFIIFGIMTPLGIALGQEVLSLNPHTSVLPAVFTAMAAGTFLFIGTLHGLARSTMIQQCCNLKQFMWVLVGFGLMAVVALWT